MTGICLFNSLLTLTFAVKQTHTVHKTTYVKYLYILFLYMIRLQTCTIMIIVYNVQYNCTVYGKSHCDIPLNTSIPKFRPKLSAVAAIAPLPVAD